jgi:hypothetical protein
MGLNNTKTLSFGLISSFLNARLVLGERRSIKTRIHNRQQEATPPPVGRPTMIGEFGVIFKSL